jgi:hypothetical protein
LRLDCEKVGVVTTGQAGPLLSGESGELRDHQKIMSRSQP